MHGYPLAGPALLLPPGRARPQPRPPPLLVSLLCQEIDGVDVLGGGGRLEQSPDAAREVALDAADRFAGGLALGAPAGDVVADLRVTARAGDDHPVQRRVDL